ncbi:MAG TPA: FtsX-like permease family protein [Streptosporangiaceae bacterium]|nr:FtsX-like permease family protein [Streptosporangiaceae bacterium]
MGQILLACRLAGRDLRHRPSQPLLLLIVLTAAMATLTLGLVLRGVTSAPFAQTRAATAGPDVVADSAGFSPAAVSGAAARDRLAALARAPGVTAHSGPFPVAWPVLRAHGVRADVMAEGRDTGRAAVDQPEVIRGSWVRPGGVVLERAFAQAIKAGVGDRVTLGGRSFLVTGIAVTAAVPVYTQVCFFSGCSGPAGRPRSFDTGLVWVTRSAARGLAAPGNPLTYYLNLRLARASSAAAFVRGHQPPPGPAGPPLTAWTSLRTAAATLVTQARRVLVPASWLLGLLALASVAVVAGARMAEQRRRVGLLKAAGGTPELAAAVLMAEHLVVALAGAAAGLVTGRLVAPLLTSPGASLVGSPGAPALAAGTVLLVTAAAVAVAGAATLVPALRAARVSTVAALAADARPPRRRAAAIRLSAGLPVPLLLGLRLVTRRPRRALLSAASFLVTGAAIVAVLVFHATLDLSTRIGGPFAGPPDPGRARVSEVLLVITVALALLAAVNAIFTTWATVADSRHFSAVVRSLGATPRQTVAGLSAAQLLPALAGVLLGIPAGTELYSAVQAGGPQGSPPVWWLLALVAGTLLAVTGLTVIPARAGAGRPIAEVLESATR